MKTKRILALLVFAVLTASAAIAQDKAQKIDALLKTYYDYGQLNGAVLVADGGKVIYKKGFGMANMEWEIPNQPDTKFRIGSVTKQFTAAIILQLVDEGKIKLDGKVTDYLTDYRKDTGERVTIHQLLNHTSGIPSYTGLPGFFQNESRNPYGVKDFVKKFASGDLEFEPGSKFSYNNSGYFLLGAIIEQVTGKPYAQVLKERIFDPLGMKDTGYDDDAPLIKKRAAGYQKTSDGYENAPYLDMLLPYAAGSIFSTVEDLYKWDQALYENKMVSAAGKELMFKPGLSNYGYGFFIYDQPIGKTTQKAKITGHSGGINGFNSLFTRVVDQKSTIIILDNVGLGRYQGNITNSIINILNNQPVDEPKKPVAEALYKIAREKGGAAAAAEYRKLKAGETAAVYDFSEGELNTLGYQLLGSGRTKDAIEIFKLNVEMFPASANPYDSLGEAYLKDGQKELALANYKKSVELDPKNVNGAQVVKRLEGKETKVDPSNFDAYAGDYEIAPGFILTVTREGDKLMGQATGQTKAELEPISETQFAVSFAGANVTFEKDSAGKVTGLVLVQGGRTIKAKKIK
jgi:CubicO group peptidase (beta-lactamase class C family)